MKTSSAKSVKKSVSIREKLLVGILLLALLIGGYMMLRVKEQVTQREVWAERLKESRDNLKDTRPKNTRSQNSEALAEEIAELEAAIALNTQTVAGIEGRFIDFKDRSAVSQMRSDISRLVISSGLRSRGVSDAKQDLTKFTEKNQQQLSSFLDRPTFNVPMTGNYFKLLAFIENLETLPNRAVVTNISLSSVSGKANKSAAQRLQINMVLSF